MQPWLRPQTISRICHSRTSAMWALPSDSCLGEGGSLGTVWHSGKFVTAPSFCVFGQQICLPMAGAVQERKLLHNTKVALNVKTSSGINSHVSIVFNWTAKEYPCWGSGSPPLDYWVIIFHQGDVRGNQKSSSKCSLTWQQIYEKKRCHYKEGKKGKVIFISKKGRSEAATGRCQCYRSTSTLEFSCLERQRFS